MTRIMPLALLVLVGCSGSYRFGAGPLLDTEGRAGFQVTAGGSIGFAFSDEVALEESGELALGGQMGPGGFVLDPIVGLDFVREAREDGFAWRVGVRGRFHFTFEADEMRTEVGGGPAFALLYVLERSGAYREHLGGELSGLMVSPMTGERQGRRYGLFALSVMYEVRDIDERLFGYW